MTRFLAQCRAERRVGAGGRSVGQVRSRAQITHFWACRGPLGTASWWRASARAQVALPGFAGTWRPRRGPWCPSGAAVEDLPAGMFRYGVGDDDALGCLVARVQSTRVPDHRFLCQKGAWLWDHGRGWPAPKTVISHALTQFLISGPGACVSLAYAWRWLAVGGGDRGSRRASRTGRICPPRGPRGGGAKGYGWCRGGGRGGHRPLLFLRMGANKPW